MVTLTALFRRQTVHWEIEAQGHGERKDICQVMRDIVQMNIKVRENICFNTGTNIDKGKRG